MSNTILCLENINKTFMQGGHLLHILNDASFVLRAGEMCGLIGPSGSGKSTLLHIAGLLDRPDSGKVFIGDQECGTLTENARTKMRNHHIGFVYQSHYLLPDFSALENVMMPQLVGGVDIEKASLKARALLEDFGLADRMDHVPAELSGGQQQRVAIARALSNDPALLLADEPTGNLDPATADQVLAILLEVVQKRNLATLIVTHNLALADKMHQVCSMHDGKLEMR